MSEWVQYRDDVSSLVRAAQQLAVAADRLPDESARPLWQNELPELRRRVSVLAEAVAAGASRAELREINHPLKLLISKLQALASKGPEVPRELEDLLHYTHQLCFTFQDRAYERIP